MAIGTKTHELRELNDEALAGKLREAKEELFNLRFQMATGQLENNRRLRTVRHDIARIYTVMRERELGLSVSPDEAAAVSLSPLEEAKAAQARAGTVVGSPGRVHGELNAMADAYGVDELLVVTVCHDPAARLPPVFIGRGERDEWFTASKLEADLSRLARLGSPATHLAFDGGHEWTPAFFAAAGDFLRAVTREA